MLDIPTPDSAAARTARETLRELNTEPVTPLVVKIGEREIALASDAAAALRETLGQLADGHGVRILGLEREVTTQEAADILNLSRPHFVRLLEQGRLPFHMVGTHHRVLLDDVLTYKAQRRARQEEGLQILADEAQKLNLGY